MDIQEIIESNSSLSSLMDTLPLRIMGRLISKTYKPNSIIFYKGDYLRYVYILYEGEVKIANTYKDGYVFEINRINVVNFLGEQAILSEKNIASVTVSSISTAKVLLIKSKDFIEWLKLDNKFALFILKDMALRGYSNSINLGAKGYLLKKQLLEQYLCHEFEKEESSNVIIKIKRQDMSERIGTSLRSLERGISELKKDGLISFQKRHICVNQLQYAQMIEDIEH